MPRAPRPIQPEPGSPNGREPELELVLRDPVAVHRLRYLAEMFHRPPERIVEALLTEFVIPTPIERATQGD